MSSFYYLLSVLFLIAERSFASFPTAVVEDEPAVAVAPEPVAHVPVATAHVAPMVAPVPAVAPVPYYPHMFSHHYYHPRAEVHNVEKSFEKESGHASETSVVSGDGHLPAGLGIHPEHLADGLALSGPFRSRLHRKKLAKKVHKSKAHKSFDKKKN